MFIRSLELRDWKSYPTAKFDFGTPTKSKNIVLVGANNGYGKTSLLEALILGIYGRKGMGALARALPGTDVDDKSYDDFLERALHRPAIKEGRSYISITVVLEGDGERIKIIRRWHFTGSGTHRRADEEVTLFEGRDDTPVRVPGPKASKEDRDDFYANIVAKKFLPVHLTEFFLFDGERVQRLARQNMAESVKTGIEGLVGVQLLRELQEDLRTYSNERRRGVGESNDGALNALNEEIQEAAERIKKASRRIAELEKRISSRENEISDLSLRLRTMTGGNSATVHSLSEEKFAHKRAADRAGEELNKILRESLALALTGTELRGRLRNTVKEELKLMEWNASKSHSADKLDQLLNGIDHEDPPLLPELTSSQRDGIQQRLRNAWGKLWHPAPPGIADEIRHAFLSESDRQRVLRQLDVVDGIGLFHLKELLHQYNDSLNEVAKLERQISGLTGAEDQIKAATDSLTELANLQASEKAEKATLGRELDADSTAKAQKSAEAGRLADSLNKSRPSLQLAKRADEIAELVQLAIADLYPKYVERLSKELTAGYRKLAHKSVVNRLTISDDCHVKMFANDGSEITNIDYSAGENQVFATALILAISKVSGTKVPIVIDTPLARLDNLHRTNVLRFIAESGAPQVIFLSQPDEIRGEYLELLRDRVGKAYHLQYEELSSGVGRSVIKEGYFKGERF
jgi:DNA sulfur modification protein DndD